MEDIMSKRRKKSDLNMSANELGDYEDYLSEFQNDMYQAPKGKKPRGKAKRKSSAHKTAYWD